MTYDPVLSAISIQQIQVFLCTAETLSFTQTAYLLHMTQPGVSKSISSLEKTLQFPLFNRIGKTIQLTEEGKFLADKWALLFHDLQENYREVMSGLNQEALTLKIGFDYDMNQNFQLWEFLDKFSAKYPYSKLQTDAKDPAILVNELYQEEYDLIIIPNYYRYQLDKTHVWKTMATSNIQVVVPIQNHLFQRRELEISDILEENVLIIDPKINPGISIAINELFRQYGHEPHFVGFCKNYPELLYALDTKNCIYIIDDFWRYDSSESKKKIPLKDQYNGLIGVWKKANNKKLLHSFTDMISCQFKA